MHTHAHIHVYTCTYSYKTHTCTGAVSVTLDDSDVTHLVVADEVDPQLIPPTTSRVLVVKQQWFWESIQIDACADETLYQAKVGAECVIDSEEEGGLEPFF